MEVLRLLLSITFSVFVSSIISLLAKDQIVFTIAPLLSFFFGKPGLWGIWEVEYPESWSEQTDARTIKILLKVRQVGTYVVARNIEGEPKYKISARLHHNDYLAGVWEDYSRAEHYGSFQNFIDNNRKSMKGYWIGFSTRQQGLLRKGEWQWQYRGKA